MINTKPQKKPVSTDWHKADIKCALEKAGWSLSKLSRKNNYSRTAAGMAIFITWPKMQEIIAKAIGVTAQEIWPSRYNEDGSPKPNVYAQRQRHLRAHIKNMSQPSPADNVKDRSAA